MVLTGKVRHAVEVVPPLLRDVHSLLVVVLPCGGVPLLLGVGNELCDVLWIARVQNCVEVVPIGEPVLRIRVLQVLHDLLVQSELRVDLVHAQLVEPGHVDEQALAHLQ